MPDDVTAAPAAPAAPAVPTSAPAPAAPVVESAPAAAPSPVPAAAPPSEAIAAPAPVAEAAKPANEFQPSLLDSATLPDSAPKPSEGTADAVKPAEAKTDAPGETPPAPIKYEFTYPEGVKPEDVSSERMSAYTGILGESKIAPEVGQKLLDMHLSELTQTLERATQRQWEVFNETQKQWRDEVMNSPDLGGANHAGAIRNIMSLVDQYGGNAAERQGLLDAFRVTGAANNPHVLRFMHRAAQALAREGEPHAAPPPRPAPPTREQRGVNRYKDTTPYQPGR